MGKRITPDRLGEEIDKILTQYGEEVEANIDIIRKKVAQKGAAAIRNEAKDKFGGTGKYAKGWTVTEESKPHYKTAIIYNKSVPGLTHLLEFGHALIIGGRNVGKVEGREHIGPVEEEICNQYVNEVVSKL